MRVAQRLVSGCVLSLNVLLVFFLLFQERIVFPSWIQAIGRMHPLLLHLPIGALVISFLLLLFRKEFPADAFHKLIAFLLSISAVTAVVSALMGLVLAKEGGYDEATLRYHLISGTAVSMLAWLLLAVDQQNKKMFNGLLGFTVVALLVAGHLGATITHGENFVLAPLMNREIISVPITDSTSLYQAAIEPVFRAKCFSCHNKQKTKGNLLMTSVESILKGGKHGAIWKSGNPEQSTFIKRINLPEENDEHMPPAGKTPLTDKEKQLFYRWVLEGADVKKAWTKFDAKDTLTLLAKSFINTEKKVEEVRYTFAFASKDKIKELNSPYRTVTQLSLESPALTAEFFVSQAFNATGLEDLKAVKEQLISLTLAGMPITDKEGKAIAEFKNLEKLDLNKTKVTGAILGSLKELKKIKSLSLAGTAVDFKSLEQASVFPDLKEVFIWNTKVDKNQLSSLQEMYPKITWNVGYPPTEVLRLTPPLLVNDSLLVKKDQKIHLKHNLPGTIIRYTLDGTTPDSLKGEIYKEPIAIEGFTIIKAIACRQEWWTSVVTEYSFFKSGYTPSSAELLTQPDKTYRGEGIKTLIDNKKSTADAFREPYWLGYRDRPLEALFYFDKAQTLRTVTISYCKNYYSYLTQPEYIELWAGNDKDHLRLIKKSPFTPPGKDESSYGIYASVIPLPQELFRCVKIIAKPVSKLPEFISKKREKAWFFVDEVIFN